MYKKKVDSLIFKDHIMKLLVIVSKMVSKLETDIER